MSLAPDLRLYRTFFLDEINQDYVRTARAKGVSENRIMWVHVLRNAVDPDHHQRDGRSCRGCCSARS